MAKNEEFFNQLKFSGLKMLPFFKAVCVYFVLDAHNQQGEYWSTLLKCAPIVALIIFILLQRMDKTKRLPYTNNVLAALITSCLGDALLDHNCFMYGMCAFAVSQVCYIFAFGFRPLKLRVGIPLYMIGIAFLSLIWSNLDSVFSIGVPVYAFCLINMCWRSIALLWRSTNILRIICAVSSVLFVMSDAMIALNKFYTPINNISVWIMITYYAAQFGFSLSILDIENNRKIKQN